MRRRYVLLGLALVAALSFALPAVGAPSPLSLAKRALKTGKSANKRAKRADRNARRALRSIKNGVPKAKTADSATVAGTSFATSALKTFGPVVMKTGDKPDLIKVGPFTLSASCESTGGTARQVRVFLTSSENGTSMAGDDNSAGSQSAGAPLVIEDPGASTGSAGSSNSDGYDDQFDAQTPSGSAITGTVGSFVTSANGGQCKAWGDIIVVHG